MINPLTKLSLIFIGTLFLVFCLSDAYNVDAKNSAIALFSSPPSKPQNRNDRNDDDGNHKPRRPAPQDQGLLEPGQSGGNLSIKDPQTPGLASIFPPGAVSEPVKIRFFNSGLPEGIPPLSWPVSIPETVVPASHNSPYFFFGVWRRNGQGALHQVERAIILTTPYAETGLAPAQEAQLRLWRYDPAARLWIRLGGNVDIFNNRVMGLLSTLDPAGNTLLALGLAPETLLLQTVDTTGLTSLIPSDRPDLRLDVPPGAVEVGSHFELTSLAGDATGMLLIPPLQVSAYSIDHQDESLSYEVSEFVRPLNLVFTTPAQAATVVVLNQGQWVEAESLGYSVTQTEAGLVVTFDRPGIFSLAAP